jgi:hypothetical protein
MRRCGGDAEEMRRRCGGRRVVQVSAKELSLFKRGIYFLSKNLNAESSVYRENVSVAYRERETLLAYLVFF